MALNISRGKLSRPQKVVIYAPEGLGKTTLASLLPSPIFFDFEGGTHHVDVARLEPSTLAEFEKWARELVKDKQDFRTVVIDTAALLKEWADALLFGTFEDKVKPGAADGARGRAVAASGKERVLFCSHSAAWDAKNRHGLKDKEPWSVETLMKVLGNPAPVTPGKSAATGAVKPTTAAPKPAPEGIKRVALTDESESGGPPVIESEGGGQPVDVEHESGGDPITGESGGDPVTVDSSGAEVVVFVSPLPTSDDPIEGIEEHEEPDEELDRMLSPHAAQVNLFLRDKQKVGSYQSYRSMPAAYRTQVLSNPSGFLARVKAYSAERSAA